MKAVYPVSWRPVQFRGLGFTPRLESPRPHLGQADFMGRVEVLDAETGAYLQGARVSIVWPTGSFVKETDQGGNASFPSSEFIADVPEDVEKGDVFYRVEAQGYKSQEKQFIPDQITVFNMTPSVTSDVSGGSADIPWVLIGAGFGVIALASVIVAVKRS